MMGLRKVIITLWIARAICSTVSAQEMLGTVLGNYSGVNSLQLNPSSMHNSKAYLDINLLSLDFFAENNYLYIDKKDYRFTRFFESTLGITNVIYYMLYPLVNFFVPMIQRLIA